MQKEKMDHQSAQIRYQLKIWNYSAVFGHIYMYTKNKEQNACKQVLLATAAFQQTCGFNRIKLFPLHYLFLEFGWIFPAFCEVRERTNTSWLCSLLGDCWWRYWVGVETALYYVFWGVLRYWFRLMWLTTVSSCAKWPHQSPPRRRFWPKLRKQRPVSDFRYGQSFFANRIFGKLIYFQNLFCSY